MMSFLVSCYFSLPFPIVQWWYQIYRTCGWIIPLTYRCGAKTSTGIFFGCDLVNWLIQVGLSSDRGEAVMYGDRLMKGGVIQHITNEFEFRDEYLYYRFVQKRATTAESQWSEDVDRGQAGRVNVTVSSGFAAENGSVSFSGLLEGRVTLSSKVKKCASTSVYSEANDSHSQWALNQKATRSKQDTLNFFHFQQNK